MDPVMIRTLLAGLTGIFMLAIILYSIRIIKGPTIPDMVLAVDALSYDLAVLIVVLAILFDTVYLAVAALPLVLWAYILDMYVAKYLERKELGD